MNAMTFTVRLAGHPVTHLFAAVTTAAVLFVACGADRANTDTATAGTATGATAFAENCAACHGTTLSGTSMGPPLLSEVYAPDHHPDSSIRNAVADGVQAHHWNFGPMAPVAVDDATVEHIIAFIRATQTTEGFQDYPPTP